METFNFDLHLLHGFLGLPQDWESIFSKTPIAKNCIYEHLISNRSVKPFSKWAQDYNSKVSATKDKGRKKVLLGYSMGGRLGLHAINEDGNPWDAAIFISTNLGLPTEEERKARRDADEVWAKRFESYPWDTLIQSWNAQAIFNLDSAASTAESRLKGGSFQFDRKESEHNRDYLARSLRVWSLGQQHRFTMSEFEIPILWMAGAEDAKCAAQAKQIFLKHRLSEVCIMPGVGHRLPWEQPDRLVGSVNEFLKRLETQLL